VLLPCTDLQDAMPPSRCFPSNLTSLDVSHNNIYEVDVDALSGLTSLAVVDFTGNMLLRITDGMFGKQKNSATRLVFRRNRITIVSLRRVALCRSMLSAQLA
jgi:Leucine-rich repeat (LRR) protein